MQFDRKILVAALVVVFATVCASRGTLAQEKEARLAHAKGAGTLKVGDETFKISSVVVKLMDDRTAEVAIISDITVFVSGTWTSHAGSQQEFDLELTGGASGGGLQGSGTVILSSDGKSVVRLNIQGVSRTTKRPFEANFEGESKSSQK